MKYFTGLDVSLATTFITIVDDNNKKKKVLLRLMLKKFLEIERFSNQKIGIESGQLEKFQAKSYPSFTKAITKLENEIENLQESKVEKLRNVK
jgi:hypothetical protein